MAYSIVYAEPFATTPAVWENTTSAYTTPRDAAYPKVDEVNRVDLVTGQGPAGETVARMNTLNGYVSFQGYGNFNASRGRMTFDLRVDATLAASMGTTTYGSFGMIKSSRNTSQAGNLVLQFKKASIAGTTMTGDFRVVYNNISTSSPVTIDIEIGEWWNWRLEWVCGTNPTGAAALTPPTADANGSITVTRQLSDGSGGIDAVQSLTGLGLYVNPSSAFDGTAMAGDGYNDNDNAEVNGLGDFTNVHIERFVDGYVGSAVFGVTTTVKATRAIAFGVDDHVNIHDTPGMVKVFGDFAVTGTTTLGVVAPGSIALDDLSDVAITSPVALQVLAYNGAGGWVNTNAVGQIISVTIALTNAQIKALPTTEINLLSALGATIRAKFIGATLRINSSAGAYTNISAGAYVVIATPGEAVTLSGYLGDNASPALTSFSDIFAGAADIVVDLIPWARDSATGFGVRPQTTTPVAGVVNTAVHLVMSNSGGDLTGGHASNSGSVILYYTPETLA